MDKFINSPLKKTKETSLSDFYRKPEYEDRHESNMESPSTLSLTPSKIKSQEHDSSKFAGKIASTLGYSKAYHPLITNDECKTLDINSNMKLKMDDIFAPQNQSARKSPKKDHILIQEPVYQQNLFTKPSSGYSRNQHLGYEPTSSDIMTKKFDNSDSDLDLNFSVEPQQIRIPSTKRHEQIINQFKLHDDDKLQSNFLITPENSLIKSPQKYLPIETRHFTPLQSDKFQESHAPSSDIIERLRFNTENMESTDKKGHYEGGYEQKSPKKVAQVSQPFDKHLEFSPGSGKKPMSQIPSPRKSIGKKSALIMGDSPNRSTKSNKKEEKQILSSDDEDASELISKIRQLQTQVTNLKSHKYQFAITKYRQQTRYELQKQLQKSLKEINSQYDIKEGQIKRQAEVQSQLFEKQISDIAKHKKTYGIILEQMKEKREKIEEEYREKVEEVRKYKERLISEWKRQSNEEIKRIINNTHGRHSIRLEGSREKMIKEKSKQKASRQ